MRTTTDIALFFAQAQGGQPQQPSLLEALLQMAPFFLFIFFIFYFVYQRPMKKEREAHNLMVRSLMVGDKVLTIGGIHGEVVKVVEEGIVLKTGDKASRITIDKSAIKGKIQQKQNQKGE